MGETPRGTAVLQSGDPAVSHVRNIHEQAGYMVAPSGEIL